MSSQLTHTPVDDILVVADAPLFGLWIYQELERHQLHAVMVECMAAARAHAANDTPGMLLCVVAGLERAETLAAPRAQSLAWCPQVLVVFEEGGPRRATSRDMPGWDRCIVMDTSFEDDNLLGEIVDLVRVGQRMREPRPRHVVVVGDAPLMMTWVRDELRRYVMDVELVDDIARTHEIVTRSRPAAVLLVALSERPTAAALDVVAQLKADGATCSVPVVCVAQRADDPAWHELQLLADACAALPISPAQIVLELDRFLHFAPGRDRGSSNADASSADRLITADSLAMPQLLSPAPSPALAPLPLDDDEPADLADDARTQITLRCADESESVWQIGEPIDDGADAHLVAELEGQLAVCRAQLLERERECCQLNEALARMQWQLVAAKRRAADLQRATHAVEALTDARQMTLPMVPLRRRTHTARGRWLATVMNSEGSETTASLAAPTVAASSLQATG